MITRTYLDTNVYNRIADHVAIPILPGRFGSQWQSKLYLSPLNVLEIMQIEDDIRRETIIRILQEICNPNILAEPEALFVDFIAEHTGLPSLKHLRLKSPFSAGDFGTAWNDIHANSAKTFRFSNNVRTNIRFLKLLNQLLHAWYRSGGNLKAYSSGALGNYRNSTHDQIISTMKQAIRLLKRKIAPDPTPSLIRDLTMILSNSILASGVTPFPEIIDKLWAALRITGTENKIKYIFDGPLKFTLSEGSLVGMAGVMAFQIGNKFSPGNILDAFHITYLPYVSELYTFDESLLSFARQHPKSPNFIKVLPAHSFLSEVLSQHSR